MSKPSRLYKQVMIYLRAGGKKKAIFWSNTAASEEEYQDWWRAAQGTD